MGFEVTLEAWVDRQKKALCQGTWRGWRAFDQIGDILAYPLQIQ